MAGTNEGLGGVRFYDALYGRDRAMAADQAREGELRGSGDAPDIGEYIKSAGAELAGRSDASRAPAYNAMRASVAPVEYFGDRYEGLGRSRLDRKVTDRTVASNLEDFRANQQTAAWKLANGVAKGVVTAATTFVDGTLGMAAGGLAMQYEMYRGLLSGDPAGPRRLMSKFVENPVSKWLAKITESANGWFSNYRTDLESGRKWWQNIGTANFWADNIIQNAGFAIGAAYSGKVATSALGSALDVGKYSKLLKGILSKVDDAALRGAGPDELLKALRDGTAKLSDPAVRDALTQAAKELRRKDMLLQTGAGLAAAQGEARIEAINAASEFDRSVLDTYGDIDGQYASVRSAMEERVAAEHPETVSYVADPATGEVRLALDAAGQAEVARLMETVDARYEGLKAEIGRRHDDIVNTVFALEVPLLGWSNMTQFGKWILGDYALDRARATAVRGAASAAARGAARAGSLGAFAGRTVEAAGGKAARAAKTAWAAVKNPVVEGAEEMNQSWVTGAVQDYGAARLNEFTQHMYDPDAAQEVKSMFGQALASAKEGFMQSWGNADDWVEFAAGAFMGGVGVPAPTVEVGPDGKRRTKWTLQGGVRAGLEELRDARDMDAKAVKAVNDRIHDPKFQQTYLGMLTSASFDKMANDAAASGDRWAYDKWSMAQLVSDIMTFDRVGMLPDFKEALERMGEPTDEDVQGVMEMLKDVDGSDASSITGDALKRRLHDNAARMAELVDSYDKVYGDLRTAYGEDAGDDFLREMTWKTMRLDSIEGQMAEDAAAAAGFVSPWLAEYRAARPDEGGADLQVLTSDGFRKFFNEKVASKDDAVQQKDMAAARSLIDGLRKGKAERDAYIDALASLSSDPEALADMQERDALRRERNAKLEDYLRRKESASKAGDLQSFMDAVSKDGGLDDLSTEVADRLAREGNAVAREFMDYRKLDRSIDGYIDEETEYRELSDQAASTAKGIWAKAKKGGKSIRDMFEAVESASVEGVPDAVVQLVRDAVARFRDDEEYASYVAEAKDEGDTAKTEQDRELDESGETLAEGDLVTKVELSAGDGVVDSDGAPVTGTYFVYGTGDGNKVYDREGRLLKDRNFHVTVPSPTGGEASLPLAQNISSITQDSTMYLFGEDDAGASGGADSRHVEEAEPEAKEEKKAKPEAKEEKKAEPEVKEEVRAVESEAVSKSKDAGRMPERPAPTPQSPKLFMKPSDPTQSAMHMKEGEAVVFGMREKGGTIYLINKRTGETVGELPRSTTVSELSPCLADLVRRLDGAFDGCTPDGNGMTVIKGFETKAHEIHARRPDYGLEPLPLPDIEWLPEDLTEWPYAIVTKKGEIVTSKDVDLSLVNLPDTTNTSGMVFMLAPHNGRYDCVGLHKAYLTRDNWTKLKATALGHEISQAFDDLFGNKRGAQAAIEKLLWARNRQWPKFVNTSEGMQVVYEGRTLHVAKDGGDLLDWFVNRGRLQVNVTLAQLQGEEGGFPDMLRCGLFLCDVTEAKGVHFIMDAWSPGEGRFVPFRDAPAPTPASEAAPAPAAPSSVEPGYIQLSPGVEYKASGGSFMFRVNGQECLSWAGLLNELGEPEAALAYAQMCCDMLGNQGVALDSAAVTAGSVEDRLLEVALPDGRTRLYNYGQGRLADAKEERKYKRVKLFRQVVSHLRGMGITVHGKDETEKFLKEHGADSVQALSGDAARNASVDGAVDGDGYVSLDGGTAVAATPERVEPASDVEGRANDGRHSSEEGAGIQELRTEDGELYGFVYGGGIYLDDTKLDPEAPVHEYAHLWDEALRKLNPELWNRGKKLMRRTKLWKETAGSDAYGRKWEGQGMSGDALDDLIASEVHARMVGKEGAKRLNAMAKGEDGDLIRKLKDWILEAWKSLKETFGAWSREDIDGLTLADFTRMTVRDFVDGVNPVAKSGAAGFDPGAAGETKAQGRGESDDREAAAPAAEGGPPAVAGATGGVATPDAAPYTWMSLGREERSLLAQQGWTQEDFDKMSREERERALDCLF